MNRNFVNFCYNRPILIITDTFPAILTLSVYTIGVHDFEVNLNLNLNLTLNYLSIIFLFFWGAI